jgi:homoserine O-succinyltransferase
VVVVRSDSSAALGLAGAPPVRIGVINIMPRAETYEPCIVRPLDRAAVPLELVWIRLRSHVYASSDAQHIERSYVPYEHAIADHALDGVILTGAPVEELAFESVRYWGELSAILADCRARGPNVLGICWGGLALARQLGIEKHTFPRKLFGVFAETVLDAGHPVVGGSDDVFRCAQSRHSGIPAAHLEAARDAGVVRLLSHGADTGYTIFESADRRFLMHLGHPEYDSARLAAEWERDAALGRADVEPPENFDLRHPVNVWRSHCNELFARWLLEAARARSFVGRPSSSRRSSRELAIESTPDAPVTRATRRSRGA